jgi:hypothetical protein
MEGKSLEWFDLFIQKSGNYTAHEIVDSILTLV